jgi:glutathionylspermidine synthase
MKRLPSPPRQDWQRTVESQGFHFHTANGQPYWDESACYLFNADEIDQIERATYELDRMCLAAVQHVIDTRGFGPFGIPEQFADLIAQSWEEDEFTLYGRFDLAYDGRSPPKLLEYNADTPTSLLEASVIQWHWLQDLHPDLDQFNSLHEKLIDAWAGPKAILESPFYFSSLEGHVEDYMTVQYLRDTAMQAGLETEYIAIEDVGWNEPRQLFVDFDERPIDYLFKLYPWEWLLREAFAPHLLKRTTRWLEPPWKMILSNKAILPLLWQLFPQSPYLLPASFQPIGQTFVKKPALGREGANVALVVDGQIIQATDGVYGGPFIYQPLAPLPNFDGNYPVLGSWMVNGFACGLGIREDVTPITTNLSRFIPHAFEPRKE